MTEFERLLREYKNMGFLLPEWLARLNPILDGEHFVIEDSAKGKVYFPAEQFRYEEVMRRYELLARIWN